MSSALGPNGCVIGCHLPHQLSLLPFSALQVSRAAATAARDFALLMGLLMQLDVGSRGSHDYIERRLLPEACDVLRRAALGLWLSGTPAAAQGGLRQPFVAYLYRCAQLSRRFC